MRAAVFTSNSEPLAIRDIERPRPGRGEVGLQVARVGICGSDLHVKEYGGMPEGIVFGHEFAGVISELGEGTQGWQVGDRVVSLPIHHCGKCEACLQDKIGLCEQIIFTGYSLDHSGGYAEYSVVPTHSLHKVPEGVSFDSAAMVEPLSVSRRAVTRTPINNDSVVLVIGTGPIGAGVVQFARLAGAAKVIVSEMTEERRELALALGADAAIDPSSAPVADQIVEIAGRRSDVIFECVGVPNLIQQAIEVAAYEATIMVVGVCFQEDRFQPSMAVKRELTIKFSNCYAHEDFAAVLDALETGGLDPSAMHTATIGLDALPKVFEDLITTKSGCKTLIDPSGGVL
ncbi:MAG: alcohol dehydrogenase catalytic domain-containing protein [Novosphingobium sp.]|nr:alcohol dehydrogenase catalytic domain-containing protein [Novosphingobium sp.]